MARTAHVQYLRIWGKIHHFLTCYFLSPYVKPSTETSGDFVSQSLNYWHLYDSNINVNCVIAFKIIYFLSTVLHYIIILVRFDEHDASIKKQKVKDPYGYDKLAYHFRFNLFLIIAHNLGVIFENDLRMDTYIQNICRSASYALYKIGRIRNYLDEKSNETLIHAFITCRIDQCNSLLYGLPDSHTAKLQRIHNSAARLVTRTRFHDHITPVLQKLHWLPVRYRIMYNILILTYKCIFMDWHHYIYKNSYRNINLLAIFDHRLS